MQQVSREMIELPPLPIGWVWTRLEEVCLNPQYGWTTSASTKGSLRLLRTTDISSGSINWNSVPFCEKEPADKEKYLLKDGDIVISRAGSVGYSCLIKNPEEAVFASYLIRFKPLIDEQYLAYFLKSPSYWKSISEKKLGITTPNVNATKLKQIPIPLPPLPEQHRIVVKIEELFTKLDAGVEALKKVKMQLKRYRQAVLKSAFEGKLTKKWRMEHQGKLEPASVLLERIKEGRKKKAKGKYKELPQVDTSRLPDLPEGWVWTRVGDVINIIPITGKKLKQREYQAKAKIPVIDQGKKFIGGYTNIERMKVECKDPVIVFGDHTKVVKYLDFDFVPGADGIKVLKPAEFFYPKLFYYFLQIVKLPEKGYARHFQFLKKSYIPLLPLPEQYKIVEEIERRLSIAEETEKIVEQSLKQAERLRQSILKKAFEGKLVPQDPNDEPASVLLERIKKEKARQEARKKQGKVKKGTTPVQRRLF